MAELPPSIEQASITALDIMEAERKDTLIKNASKAHMAGDTWASKQLKIDIAFDLVQQEALDFAKQYAKEVNAGYTTIKGEKVYWLKDRAKADRERIVNALETGIREGHSIPEISKALQGELDVMKSQATRISRTEVARIQNQGTLNRYEKHGVQKVKWLVFEPCEICSPFANNIYDINDLPDEIPVHPHCRCGLAPVVEASKPAEAAKPIEPKSEFVPAASKKEAEQMVNERLNVVSNFGRADIAKVNEFNEALYKIVPSDNKFDYIGVSSGYNKFMTAKTGEKFTGGTLGKGTPMQFRKVKMVNGDEYTALMVDFKNADEMMKYVAEGRTKGELVAESVEDMVAHEYGHYLAYNGGKIKLDSRGMVDGVGEIFRNPDFSIRKEVGKYAGSDYSGHEMVAELYCMKHKGMEIPDILKEFVP